jgi:hypothetical protein
MQRLITFLAVKSIVEVLIVSVVGVVFYLSTFNAGVRGALDVANKDEVAGWAMDLRSGSVAVPVQLFIDGQFAGATESVRPRPDIVAAGLARESTHGFSFAVPPLEKGWHEAIVYAVFVRSDKGTVTLSPVGKPIRFQTF